MQQTHIRTPMAKASQILVSVQTECAASFAARLERQVASQINAGRDSTERPEFDQDRTDRYCRTLAYDTAWNNWTRLQSVQFE
jgi:hypothetical protein